MPFGGKQVRSKSFAIMIGETIDTGASHHTNVATNGTEGSTMSNVTVYAEKVLDRDTRSSAQRRPRVRENDVDESRGTASANTAAP